MKISAIIVNWNSGEQLKECMESLQYYHSDLLKEVIVVDNNSSDDSMLQISHMVFQDFEVKLISSDINMGFGKACNTAAELATGEYLLFLNPDAQIYSDTLVKVINFIEVEDNVGVCGIKLIDSFNKVQRHCTSQPTLKHYVNHSFGLSAFFPRRFPYIFLRDFDHLTDRNVPHTIGAFYLIRRKIFEDLNGFDERFFVYLEDLDLSRRVSNAGYDIHYLASASAFHKGGGTSEKVKAHRLFYSLTSRILFGFKHFSRKQAYVLIFLTIVVEFITRLLKAIIILSKDDLINTFKAYHMLIKDLPTIIRKGRGINE